MDQHVIQDLLLFRRQQTQELVHAVDMMLGHDRAGEQSPSFLLKSFPLFFGELFFYVFFDAGDEILFDPQSVLSIAYKVRNARGGRFEFFDLWGDGETEEEQGKHIRATEEKILGTLLEHYRTETWYRTPVRESDYHRSSEVVNHGSMIVDFLKTGDVIEGMGDDAALDERIRCRNTGEAYHGGVTSLRHAA